MVDVGTYEHNMVDRIATVDAIHTTHKLIEMRGGIIERLELDLCQIDFQQGLLRDFCSQVIDGHWNPVPLPYTIDKIKSIKDKLESIDWKKGDEFYRFREFRRSLVYMD